MFYKSEKKMKLINIIQKNSGIRNFFNGIVGAGPLAAMSSRMSTASALTVIKVDRFFVKWAHTKKFYQLVLL